MTIPDLPAGLVRIQDYQAIRENAAFDSLHEFSRDFLRVHRDSLKSYSGKWVGNPLLQWSRLWGNRSGGLTPDSSSLPVVAAQFQDVS